MSDGRVNRRPTQMWLGRLTSYLAAFSTVTLVLVYILYLPTLLTGKAASDLVREYYYQTPLRTFALDAVVVAAYVGLAMAVAGWLRVPSEEHAAQLLVVAATSAAVSTGFMVLLPLTMSPSAFFVRWFARVGWRAVVYDVTFLSAVYVVMVAVHTWRGLP